MARTIWFALVYVCVLAVAVAEENALDSQFSMTNGVEDQALNDLGISEDTDPGVELPRAKLSPPTEVPPAAGTGHKSQDRRVVEIASGPKKDDPRRSQLHPDCHPFSEDNVALDERVPSVTCSALCEQKKCVSYQEFPEGDRYYPKGECKLFKCPPRFMGTDTRRSEVPPNCEPFSEQNGDKIGPEGLFHSCSGMCSKNPECKSYVEWDKDSKMFPKGECKLYKCSPKYDIVARAEREATRLKLEAKQSADAVKAAAKEQKRLDEEYGKKVVQKAKNTAAEIEIKSAAVTKAAHQNAIEIRAKASDEAKQKKETATKHTDALKERATKAAAEIRTKANERAAKAVQDEANTKSKDAKLAANAEHESTLAVRSAAKLKEQAQQDKLKADADAGSLLNKANAEASEAGKVSDEVRQKVAKLRADEKSAKSDRLKKSEEKIKNNLVEAQEKSAEIKQKAADKAVKMAQDANVRADAIKEEATKKANEIQLKADATEKKAKSDESAENINKQNAKQAHREMLEKLTAKEQTEKSAMLRQLAAKQASTAKGLQSDESKEQGVVQLDEKKGQALLKAAQDKAAVIEGQAAEQATKQGVKAEEDKKLEEAKAAKTKADAKVVAANLEASESKENESRLDRLRVEAQANEQEAKDEESRLKAEKDSVAASLRRANSIAAAKATDLAKQADENKQSLELGERANEKAGKATEKAQETNDLQTAEATLARSENTARKALEDQVPKALACQSSKEIVAKTGEERQRSIAQLERDETVHEQARDSAGPCNAISEKADEKKQKAEAMSEQESAGAKPDAKAAKVEELKAEVEELKARASACSIKAEADTAAAKAAVQASKDNAADIAKKVAVAESQRTDKCAIAKISQADEASAKALVAQAKADNTERMAKEKRAKELALRKLSSERDVKAKESEILSKSVLKGVKETQIKADAASTQARVDAAEEAKQKGALAEKAEQAAEQATKDAQAAKALADNSLALCATLKACKEAAADSAANPDNEGMRTTAVNCKAAEDTRKSACQETEERAAANPKDADLQKAAADCKALENPCNNGAAASAAKAAQTAEQDKAAEASLKNKQKLADEKRDRRLEEQARQLAIRKKLVKAAGLEADKASAKDKAIVLQDQVDESKAKSQEAKAKLASAKIATEAPQKKLVQAQQAHQVRIKKDNEVQTAFNAAQNKFNEATRVADLAQTDMNIKKDRVEKAESALDAEAGPYKEASQAEQEASQKVDDAVKELQRLQPPAELGEAAAGAGNGGRAPSKPEYNARTTSDMLEIDLSYYSLLDLSASLISLEVENKKDDDADNKSAGQERNNTAVRSDSNNMQPCTDDKETVERREERTKRRLERMKELRIQAEEERHASKAQADEATERTSKAQERGGKAAQALQLSSELKQKSDENKAKSVGAAADIASNKTNQAGELSIKSREAGERNAELTSKAGEKRKEAIKETARANERSGKAAKKTIEADSIAKLVADSEARSEECFDNAESKRTNEATAKAKERFQLQEDADNLKQNETAAAARHAAATIDEERLSKTLEGVAASRETTARKVQEAEIKEKQTCDLAATAVAKLKENKQKMEATLASETASHKKAAKSATAGEQAEADVARLMNQTNSNNQKVKQVAGEEVAASKALQAAQATSNKAAEEAATASEALQNSDEGAHKASQASLAAQKKAKENGMQRATMAIRATAAAEQAKSAKTAVTLAESQQQSAKEDSDRLETLQHQANTAHRLALANVEDANREASSSGNRFTVKMESGVTNMTKSEFKPILETAFAQAVASALNLDEQKVVVTAVTGATRLTVQYKISAGDSATGESNKDFMVGMDSQKLLKLFQASAAKLGEPPPPVEIGQTSGNVLELSTPAQSEAVQREKERNQYLLDATRNATIGAQTLALAITRVSDAKEDFLVAQTQQKESNENQARDNSAAVWATGLANSTANSAKMQEKAKQDAAARSASAASVAEKGASLVRELGIKLDAIRVDLQAHQQTQEELGRKLNEATVRRSTADIAAQNDAGPAADTADEAKRLLEEQKEVDATATEATQACNEALAALTAEEKAVQTYKDKEVTLVAQLATARNNTQLAAKEVASVQAKISKAKAQTKMISDSAKAEERAQDAKDANTAQPVQITLEVSTKLEGMKASEFNDAVKKAFAASIASSFGVGADEVEIEDVQDTSELLVQSLGDSSDGNSGVEVSYSVAVPSKAAVEKLQTTVEALAPADMVKAFEAEAASLGVTIPSGMVASAPTSKVHEEKSGFTSNTAQLKAARVLLKAEEAQLGLAAAKAKTRKKRFEEAKALFDASEEEYTGAEQRAFDLKAQRAAAEKELEAEQVKKEDSEAKLAAAESALKVAKEGEEEADLALKKADIEAQIMAGKASGRWSEFLKGDADSKAAEATGTSKKEVILDDWTLALAKTVQESGACQSTAQKFQTIIATARDSFLNKAKNACVAQGKHWEEPLANQTNPAQLG